MEMSTSSLSISTIPFSPAPVSFRRHLPAVRQKLRFHSPASSSIVTREPEIEMENRKFELLRAVSDTQRGLTATPHQRSSIEEALVNVESLDAGKPIDLGLLDGTWRLQYTSAPDVLVLFQSAATLPFLEVDQIFQKFECADRSGQGIVRNIVRWSIPRLLERTIFVADPNRFGVRLRGRATSSRGSTMYIASSIVNSLQEHEGATLLVSAKFSLVSIRNIYLEFEEVAIQNINISEELQALLAPAILPRSFFSLQILQFIRSFKAQVPVRTSQSQRRSVGGLYYLSYLDSNMLLGRSVGGGGVFIFTRAQPFT